MSLEDPLAPKKKVSFLRGKIKYLKVQEKRMEKSAGGSRKEGTLNFKKLSSDENRQKEGKERESEKRIS